MNLISLVSTQTFIIPIIYAFNLEQYVLLSSYFIMYIGSTCFHSSNNNSFLYNFDIFTSRLSTFINFCYACNKIPIHFNILLLNNLTITYLYSCSLYQLDSYFAVYSYVYFHLWVSVSGVLLCKRCTC